jgi:hypothetical protein
MIHWIASLLLILVIMALGILVLIWLLAVIAEFIEDITYEKRS